MFTHKPGTVYQVNGATVVNVSPSYTGNTEYEFDATVADGTTNLEFDVPFADDDLQSCILSSDQALTLKVNSSGSPAPSISLLAGKPLDWQSDSYYANPFTTTPVTKIFISNASGFPAAVKFYFLIDSD